MNTSPSAVLNSRIGLKNDIAMNTGKEWTLAGIAGTLRLQRSIFLYWDHINLAVVKNNVLYIAVVSPTGKPPMASAQRVSFEGL